MKKREGASPIDPPEYGRSLQSLTVNLLVRDIERAVLFQREVLGATIVYTDPDLAIVTGYGAQWMLHSDHTYLGHPMHWVANSAQQRGAGLEVRLHGCDPDKAEAKARELGFPILKGATDQPDHGLREVHIADDEGYIWVPDIPLADS